MKLLFFDDFRLGVLKGDAVVDVSDTVKDIPHTGPPNLITGLIERFADYKGRLESAASRGQGKPVSQVRIRPPLPKPYNIVAMAVNYMEDGTRSDQRLSQVPQRRHRRRRHHGAPRRPRHDLRGRGGGGAGHRQAGLAR